MSVRAVSPIARTRAASTSTFVASFASILVAIALLLVLDLFLARVDRRESAAHAAAEYAAGHALMAAGRAQDAEPRFAAAVATDRTNVSYALALGDAMLERGQTGDAEATLRALLDRAENDGAVNLSMAHVMLREDRPEDAKAYFHRAIFGHWGADSTVQRTRARFELIDVLATRDATAELLAELLPLEETSPDSIALLRRLGHLFILAGSPARAIGMFRDVLRHDPRDADAYSGMGQAALALGNFRTARADLEQALRLHPDDAGIVGALALADTVLALDPTASDIGSHERFVRGRALLLRTIATLAACDRPGATAAVDSARTMLSSTVASRGEDSAGEAMIALSTELWTARPSACEAATHDSVLRLVQSRLAQ